MDETSESDLAVAPFILSIAGCRVINPATTSVNYRLTDAILTAGRIATHTVLARDRYPGSARLIGKTVVLTRHSGRTCTNSCRNIYTKN